MSLGIFHSSSQKLYIYILSLLKFAPRKKRRDKFDIRLVNVSSWISFLGNFY